MAVWLVCGAFLLVQSNPSSTGATARSGLEVISDTQGVDFGPYLQTVEKSLKLNWYAVIPESARAPIMKKGEVGIEFASLKDGKVAGMKLVSRSGDVALDRGAWDGITASNPFPPLPTEFAGSSLALRVHFYYNHSPDSSLWVRVPEQVRLSEILIATPQPSNSAQLAEAQHKAQDLLDAIRRGGRFADFAKASSEGPTAARGGDLGYFDHSKLAPAIAELVFQMKVGDVSDVVRTKQGFVILQVTERPSPADMSLEVSNQPITAELAAYLAEVTQKVRQSLDKIDLKSAAPSENKQGGVTVQFLIQRNGAISHPKVTSRSGNTELRRCSVERHSCCRSAFPIAKRNEDAPSRTARSLPLQSIQNHRPSSGQSAA
jgi:TonB family protein